VVGATSYGDLSQFAQQQSRPRVSSCRSTTRSSRRAPSSTRRAQPAQVHRRDPLQERRDPDLHLRRDATSQHIPNDVLRELHGFIHMFEDTPEFVARTSSARPGATSTALRRRSSRR
jgi:hypothetical protein